MRWIPALLSGAAAFGAVYDIGPAPGAEFKLHVLKTGLMAGKVHVFTYEQYSGRLDYDESEPAKSSVLIEIEAASIVCRDTWVSAKDKVKITALAREMMDAARHPRMTFRSTSVTLRPDGAYDVRGVLTLKGISRPVTVKVSALAEGPNLRLKGSAVVLRRDFNVKPPTPPFGVINNKEEMPVEFNLLAKKSN